MELIPQEVCASSTSMPIINCKETASGPLVDLLELWLNNIEDYANSIFIIISNNALMSIRRITTNHSILFACEFSWMIALNVSFNLF
jgi:hypothetical protein